MDEIDQMFEDHPDLLIDMLQAQKAMAGEYACACGVAGDDQEKIENCKDQQCYFRNEDGEIDAPYLNFPDIDAQIKELEAKAAEKVTTTDSTTDYIETQMTARLPATSGKSDD